MDVDSGGMFDENFVVPSFVDPAKTLAFTNALKKLNDPFPSLFEGVNNAEEGGTVRNVSLDELIEQIVCTNEDTTEEQYEAYATCFLHIVKQEGEKFHLKDVNDVNDEYLETCVSKSLFCIWRHLWKSRHEDSKTEVLLNILKSMHMQFDKTGYLFLFFLATKKSEKPSDCYKLYSTFARRSAFGELYTCLLMDLKKAREKNFEMLLFLIPFIFKTFPTKCLDDPGVFLLIVSAVDPYQLEHIQFSIMTGETVMLGAGVFDLLEISLNWETFEQLAVWSILKVHDIPIETILPLLPRLDSKNHAEALSNILTMLKEKVPTQEIVQVIISRRTIGVDLFTVSLLRNWAIHYPKELSEHLSVVLSKAKPRQPNQSRKNLRARSKTNNRSKIAQAYPVTDDMLTHVDNLRKLPLPKSCDFFRQDLLIACLLQMRENYRAIGEEKKFDELFAFINGDSKKRDDSDDDNVPLNNVKSNMRNTTKRASKVTSRSRGKVSKYNETDSDDSEENFQSKRKRRSRAVPNGSSDSD